jgi:DNA-directed RNA polymerase specialized sigma24 family protein
VTDFRQLDIADLGHTTPEDLELVRARRQLDKLLATLDTLEWCYVPEVVDFIYANPEGASRRAVARALGISVDEVEKTEAAALKRLRNQVEKLGYEPEDLASVIRREGNVKEE